MLELPVQSEMGQIYLGYPGVESPHDDWWHFYGSRADSSVLSLSVVAKVKPEKLWVLMLWGERIPLSQKY